MLVTIPYTYLLYHIPTNTFYYGVRWKKGCSPEEFWKTYHTSSEKLIPLFRTLFGDESFEYEIRHTFSDKLMARIWEKKVLRRMKVLKNPDVWLNRTDNEAILNLVPLCGEKHPQFGRKMTQEFCDNQRNRMMGNTIRKGSTCSQETIEKMKLANVDCGRGIPKTEKHKLALRKPKSNTKNMGRYVRTPETRKKISESLLGNKNRRNANV